MAEIIATGGGSDQDLKENLFKLLIEKFQSLDKFYKGVFILTGLFAIAIISTGAVVYNLKTHAGGGGISSVGINPGTVNLTVGKIQPLSTIAYSYAGVPFFSGVSYEWSMSSDNSIATFSKTVSDITELTALKAGCGQLTVIARDGFTTITKSIPVVVSDTSGSVPSCATPTPTQSPTPTSISWTTDQVSLAADNLYVDINGKRYTPSENTTFASNPIHLSGGYYYTDIRADWSSKYDGSWMALLLGFRYKPGGFWQVDGVRTLDGNTNTNYLDYGPNDEFNQPIENSLGDSYISSVLNLTTNSSSANGFTGKIHFENVHITPFKGFSLTPTPQGPTPTPGTPYQLSMTCTPNEILSNSSTKVIKATLVYAKTGVPVAGKSITWTRTGNSSYPLISPSSSTTDVGGTAYTNIWMPQGFSGSGSTSINAVFSGDSTYYSTACNTKVSYNIGATPTPTPAYHIVEIYPLADSYVTDNNPSKNFGTSSQLAADANPKEITYFKFKLPDLTGKKLNYSMLALRVPNVAGAESNGTFRLKVAGSNWTETGVNYTNRPSLGAIITSQPTVERQTTYGFQMKSYTQSHSGQTIYLGIDTTSADGAIFSSREGGTSTRPHIEITYWQ